MSKEYFEVDERRGYQWPASSLTGKEMAILAGWREKTGTPISHLLKQSILEMDKIVNGGIKSENIPIG
jgi:hypothetical protein